MSFFNFGQKTFSFLSGRTEKTKYYSFMEIGDLVYYHDPETKESVLVTVESFICDDEGNPVEVSFISDTGEPIITPVSNIKY